MGGGKKLPKSVDSILKQSYLDFELILVENGSTDNSWQVCQMLKKTDRRIIIAQSELSTTYARKKGIELARGEYITFCDCDDMYINNQSFSRMIEIFEQTGSDIVQFGHYINCLGN